MSTGFCLFEKLSLGACWDKKHDWEPSQPSTMTEFSDVNLIYIRKAFKTRTPDEYAGKMLETLLTERGVVLRCHYLQSCDNHQTTSCQYTSSKQGRQPQLWLFAIVSEASDGGVKARRGEDWRRSGHNATTQTLDAPCHHTVDDLTLAARWLHRREHHDLHIWRHDYHSAYRQLLLDQPQMALLLLFTEFGRNTLDESRLIVWSIGTGLGVQKVLRLLNASRSPSSTHRGIPQRG